MNDTLTAALSPTATATANYTPGEARVTTKTLGQNDFLKLLVAQFTHQDPLNPKADTDFIGQMATFSNLEATKGMSNDFAMLRASSMLGREVMVQADADPLTGLSPAPVLGTISQIISSKGSPLLRINDQSYTLQQVLSMSQPPPVTPGKVPAATVNQ